jgi:ADP-dependent phosphofructokinase/glucokinase
MGFLDILETYIVDSTNKQYIKKGLAFDKKFTEFDADPDELKKGIKIELEHTDDENIAKEIALDHLAEIPDYYTRLVSMEKQAEM